MKTRADSRSLFCYFLKSQNGRVIVAKIKAKEKRKRRFFVFYQVLSVISSINYVLGSISCAVQLGCDPKAAGHPRCTCS
jgi:hypothetical protein